MNVCDSNSKSNLCKYDDTYINDLLFLDERLRKRLMTFQKEGVKFAIKKQGRLGSIKKSTFFFV